MQDILELLDADVAELISVKQREGIFNIFDDVDWQLNTAVLTVLQLEDSAQLLRWSISQRKQHYETKP